VSLLLRKERTSYAAVLEQAEFAKHLHTKFRIRINESESVEAELADVSDLRLSERQERFAVVFRTSNETFLGQGTRDVEHDLMGNLLCSSFPLAVTRRE
jgi:phosphoserine aminotransferase